MKQLLVSIILMLIFITEIFAQKILTIKGSVVGDIGDTTKIYLYRGNRNDSTVIKNGTFSFSMPFTEDAIVTLVPEYMIKRQVPFRHAMIITDKPGIYEIKIDSRKRLSESPVSGSAANSDYLNFLARRKEVFTKIAAEMKTGAKPIDYDDPKIQEKHDSLMVRHFFPFIEKYVATNPKSYLSAFVLFTETSDLMPLEQKKKLYTILAPEVRKTAIARDFYRGVEGIENSAIGKAVANFSLKTPEEKVLSFADLNGKYRLIDFWASWCIPCRQSFPHLRKIYQELKSDRFEMISISTDQSKAAWLKAVGEEKNPWPQVLDTEKVAKSFFAVTAIPTMYLIGPDGRILMKEIGFEPDGNGPIEKKLRELLNKKS